MITYEIMSHLKSHSDLTSFYLMRCLHTYIYTHNNSRDVYIHTSFYNFSLKLCLIFIYGILDRYKH